MIAVIQRVSEASVSIDHQLHSSIGIGFLVLIGIEENDTNEDVEWLAPKIANMRIFSDDKGLMNLSLKEVDGKILLISQFTLHASTKKGNRPSFLKAAKPAIAIPLYEKMISSLNTVTQTKVETGIFGADMKIKLCNDGPVTIIIDSKNKQ